MSLMFSRFAVTIYLILVPSKPKKTYFISCLIQILGFSVICLSYLMPEATTILFILGIIIFGLGRGVFAFPYLLLLPIFNNPEDLVSINVWMALANLGQAFGTLIGSLVVNILHWKWVYGMLIYSFLYLITGILTYVYIPELNIN